MDFECCLVGGEAVNGFVKGRDVAGTCSAEPSFELTSDIVVIDAGSIVPSLPSRNVMRPNCSTSLTTLSQLVGDKPLKTNAAFKTTSNVTSTHQGRGSIFQGTTQVLDASLSRRGRKRFDQGQVPSPRLGERFDVLMIVCGVVGSNNGLDKCVCVSP